MARRPGKSAFGLPGWGWFWAAALGLSACATTGSGTGPSRSGLPPSIVLKPSAPEPELLQVHLHRVKRGEDLYRIALAHHTSVAELKRLNHIEDPRKLAVGQMLVVPAGGGAGSAGSASGSHAEPSSSHPSRSPLAHTLDWPLHGVLYAGFGHKGKQPHDGIDLAAPLGTPVKTAAPGKVLYAGEQHGYGKIVIVQHPKGLITVYAHNRDLRVRTGQRVRRGQVIATVGRSGETSGPHLHFEVRVDGRPVDPMDYLKPIPAS